MNKTSIAWTDFTSNPIRARNKETGATGHYCTHVTDACKNCYAGVWNRDRFGTGLDFLAQNASKIEMFLNEDELREWSKPKYRGKRVFVCDMTDWCHELVPDEWRDKMLAAMALAPEVTFQLLTKRPETLRTYLTTGALGRRWVTVEGQAHNILVAQGQPEESAVNVSVKLPLPNVWLGVTAGDQADADRFIPVLLETPAAVRFVSYEPALGPLDLIDPMHEYDDKYHGGEWDWLGHEFTPKKRRIITPMGMREVCSLCGNYDANPMHRHVIKKHPDHYGAVLDWIIVGGESGANARPFNPQWARDVRDQCAEAGVACFVKQMGGKRFPDDRLESLPEDLRVREFPREVADVL